VGIGTGSHFEVGVLLLHLWRVVEVCE